MQKADQDLLTKAGIDVGDRMILKFIPKDLEIVLVGMERAYQNASPKEIRKTRFGVQPEGDGFKFYIMEQTLKR